MDVLIQHCLRELAFDGEFGCDVPRLARFVKDHFASNASFHHQSVDDAYMAFVWSILVQQPNVILGVLPEGSRAEVWVAPRPKTKTKPNKKGRGKSKAADELNDDIPVGAGGDSKDEEASLPVTLTLLADARSQPLARLIALHGAGLHIAVDAATAFAAVNGSHIRSNKLTPMVYTALQLVTRARDEGLSVLDLGRKTGYDQKSCFYLVKQLVELDLIVKLRKGGVSTNFCIHRYFFDRSPLWSQIREEESRAKLSALSEQSDMLGEHTAGITKDEVTGRIQFAPIDSRHMSSLELLRGRLLTLLRHSANHMHISQNLITALGFSNPKKTDRRFFSTRLRELIDEGLVEKIIVPSASGRGNAVCIHLVGPDEQTEALTSTRELVVDVIGEGTQATTDMDDDALKFNVSVHKQLIDLLAESGTAGMTVGELSLSLANMDKRTIELILTRLQRNAPPPNLLDLRIIGVMENYGRERRHRYFTLASFLSVAENEQLEHNDPDVTPLDLSALGNFTRSDTRDFFASSDDLRRVQDGFERPHFSENLQNASAKQKRTKVYKNPVLPDGTVKKGRPKKDPDSTLRPQKKRRKTLGADLKRNAIDQQDLAPPSEDAASFAEVAVLPSGASHYRKRNNTLISDVSVKKIRRKDFAVRSSTPKRKLDAVYHEDEEVRETGSRAKRKKTHSDVADDDLSPRRSQRNRGTDGSRNKDIVTASNAPRSKLMDQSTIPEDATLESTAIDPGPTQFHDEVVSTGDDASNACIQKEIGDPNHDEPNHSISVSANTVLPLLLHQESSAVGRQSVEVSVEPNIGRANVSNIRREKEILTVIQSMGGVVQLYGKEFLDAHEALLLTLAENCEPASAPAGTRFDKRTGDATIKNLETKGRIKVLTTSLPVTGVPRLARIAYVPETNPDQIRRFLLSVTRKSQGFVPPAKKWNDTVAYGFNEKSFTSPISTLPEHLTSWQEGGIEVADPDDQRTRNFLITEHQTIAQLYGYIVGRMARAKELHLYALRHLEGSTLGVVSSGERIFDLTFFWTGISISTYLRLVATLVHEESVAQLINSAEGRDLRVENLPPHLHASLQIGRSRSRTRLLDLMDILRCLGLATPLIPSTRKEPWVSCESNGDYPTAFDISPSNWTPQTAPMYWRFNSQSNFSFLSGASFHPVLIRDVTSAMPYWQELQEACAKEMASLAIPRDGELVGISSADVRRTLTTLQRLAAWRTSYVLSWNQCQVLRRFIDSDAPHVDIQLSRKLAHLTWAPVETVHNFLLNEQSRTHRLRKHVVKAESTQFINNQPGFAQRVFEIRAQREQEWQLLLAEVQLDTSGAPATKRMERIREHFFHATNVKDTVKWKEDIMAALTESATTALPALRRSIKSAPRRTYHPPPPLPATSVLLGDELEKINRLIQAQGIVEQSQPRIKTKRGGLNTAQKSKEKEVLRRHRFKWTKDYDELAKDASVVIRARVQSSGNSKVEWSSLQQVFPGVKQNTVRQRIVSLLQEPGCESYTRRLQEAWYELYKAHCGTAELPDENSQSMTEFPLATHIAFLRKHLDKAAARLGVTQRTEVIVAPNLPDSLGNLLASWDIIEASPTTPSHDFLWTFLTDETREKSFVHEVFTTNPWRGPSCSDAHDLMQVTESALKMVMGTPNEVYDTHEASNLLSPFGSQCVGDAQDRLLLTGVFSKIQKGLRYTKPGRTLKISDANESTLGGLISQDVFQDAHSLIEMIEEGNNEWREWPLTSTDGDTAVLLQFTSENKATFRIDTSRPQRHRDVLEWNSKKAFDDQNEPNIAVSFTVETDDTVDLAERMIETHRSLTPAMGLSTELHGKTSSGLEACCRLTTTGTVDCRQCLQQETLLHVRSISEEDASVVANLLSFLESHGPAGASPEQLVEFASERCWEEEKVRYIAQTLAELPVPLAYWLGYSDSVLVSAANAHAWTVTVCRAPTKKLFPRRWLDIHGHTIPEVWNAAVRSTIGIIFSHPAVPQDELHCRMKQTFDRSEVNELISHLFSRNFLEVRTSVRGLGGRPNLRGLTREEERNVFWTMASKTMVSRRWYEV